MVVTHGPRGHGSGRAPTPEKEAARREKIGRAVRGRKERVHVLIETEYAKEGVEERYGAQWDETHVAGWDYEARAYRTHVPADIVNRPDKLAEFLDARYPNRRHYHVRVSEVLS